MLRMLRAQAPVLELAAHVAIAMVIGLACSVRDRDRIDAVKFNASVVLEQ